MTLSLNYKASDQETGSGQLALPFIHWDALSLYSSATACTEGGGDQWLLHMRHCKIHLPTLLSSFWHSFPVDLLFSLPRIGFIHPLPPPQIFSLHLFPITIFTFLCLFPAHSISFVSLFNVSLITPPASRSPLHPRSHSSSASLLCRSHFCLSFRFFLALCWTLDLVPYIQQAFRKVAFQIYHAHGKLTSLAFSLALRI